jgi:hypothetical protein
MFDQEHSRTINIPLVWSERFDPGRVHYRKMVLMTSSSLDP